MSAIGGRVLLKVTRTRERAALMGLAVLEAATLAAGCRQDPRKVLHQDLVTEARVARWVHADGVRGLICPPGTVYAMRPQGLKARAQPRLVSNAILEWPAPSPRRALLDIERPAWGSGEARVMLNRTRIATLSLRSGRASYGVRLPQGEQRAGLNRLRVTFPGEDSGRRPPPAGPPVRLHGLSVGRPGRVTPPPTATSGGPGPPTLALPAGSGLEYAFRLPEEAELRFTPHVPAALEGPISFRVELAFDGEATREVSVIELGPGAEPSELRVPLPGGTGQPALLGLHVAATSRTHGAIGTWEAPRVLGLPRISSPPVRMPSASLEALRGRLRDAGVLLIVLDAASARHFGCYGYGRRTTPEIDRLAREGFLFEHAYTPAPFTGLAMASLWTSQHPQQHHHGVSHRGRLPEQRVVLAELLRDEGIPSAAFIGNRLVVEAGLTRGFPEVGPLHLTSKSRGMNAEDSPLERIVTSISEVASGRSLTYLHYTEPHFPYDPPPPFDTVFGSDNPAPEVAHRSWFKDVGQGLVRPKAHEIAYLERLYDGNLAAVDHEIGLLRRRLEAEGRWRDLVVIVTSDHGESFWEHGQLTHGTQVYEEMVKIPLILKLPGEGHEPTRIDVPVDLLDLGATLADIFGVTEAAGTQLPGRSLLPLLVDDSVPRRPLIAQTLGERPTYSFLAGDLKLIHDPNWGGSELFDLEEDPVERRDLARSRPVLAELLRQSLYRWLRDLDRGEPALLERPILTPENEDALRALGYVE